MCFKFNIWQKRKKNEKKEKRLLKRSLGKKDQHLIAEPKEMLTKDRS